MELTSEGSSKDRQGINDIGIGWGLIELRSKDKDGCSGKSQRKIVAGKLGTLYEGVQETGQCLVVLQHVCCCGEQDRHGFMGELRTTSSTPPASELDGNEDVRYRRALTISVLYTTQPLVIITFFEVLLPYVKPCLRSTSCILLSIILIRRQES